MSSAEKRLEITPILIILGVALVVGGFGLIALVTIAKIANPSSLFDYVAFGMFGGGVISIWAAWHKLS